MSAAVREAVTVPARDLAKGDRFRDGWVVKAVRTKGDKTTVVLGKSGYRGQHPRLFDADRPLSVERRQAQATAGSYIRSERKNRETGTTIQVLDLSHPDSEFEPETTPVAYDADGNVTKSETSRWATVCVEHGSICTHPTLAAATGHAAAPTGWCPECRGDEA